MSELVNVETVEGLIKYLNEYAHDRPTKLCRTSKGVETKKRIIQACYLVFEEHGETGISISKIAKAAKISKGNLTYYYQTKEELLHDMFYEIVPLFAQKLGVCLNIPGKSNQQILQLALTYTHNQAISHNRFLLQTDGYLLNNIHTTKDIGKLLNVYWLVMTKLIQITNPNLTHKKAKEISLFIRSLLHGIFIIEKTNRSEGQTFNDLQDNLEHYFRLAFEIK